jgi:hypothetical protein
VSAGDEDEVEDEEAGAGSWQRCMEEGSAWSPSRDAEADAAERTDSALPMSEGVDDDEGDNDEGIHASMRVLALVSASFPSAERIFDVW